ncbi:MAG: hypothetical protein F4X56_09260 [Gammaproteobacteria bacterium]|nr:hypothetical protein [Gammaproteobacteria bacterium]
MIAYRKTVWSIVRQEWVTFLRSRQFLVFGLLSPLALAAILWIFIFSNGGVTSDGIDRWKYFQSEVKRFGEDVNGTYAFEKSDDRILFYVVDQANLDIEFTLREELLRRDLTRMIDYLKQTPLEEWKWFQGSDDRMSSAEQLWTEISYGTVTAETLISTYELQHDPTFSSRLTTTNEERSWFVDGWNENVEDIARSIPTMSFSRVVHVFTANEAWVKSVWVPAFIEIPENFLETHQANCFLAQGWFTFVRDYPLKELRKPLQSWFEDLISSQLDDYHESTDLSNVDQLPRVKPAVHLELQSNDSLDGVKRQYERTESLSTFIFSFIYLLCIGCVWGLLYFDPNLKLNEDATVNEPLYTIMDGRVLGTMLKIFSVLGIWFVLLFLPIWFLLGTVPAFGAGALTKFFNPLDRIHYLIFFIIGLMTHCYVFHILSLLRQFLRSITLILIAVNFTLMSTTSMFASSSSAYDFLCFMPLMGISIMVTKTFAYPEPLSYIFIVLIAIGFLFGCRFFVKSEERFQSKKSELKYIFHPS